MLARDATLKLATWVLSWALIEWHAFYISICSLCVGGFFSSLLSSICVWIWAQSGQWQEKKNKSGQSL